MRNFILSTLILFFLISFQSNSQDIIAVDDSDNFNVSSAGWYRVGHWAAGSGRGSAKVVVATLGGSFTPQSVVIDAYKDWGSGAQLQVKGIRSSYFDDVRITRENDDYYIEVYIDRAIEGRIYVYKQEGQLNNFNGLGGDLNTGGGLVLKSVNDIYAGTYFNENLIADKGVTKLGKTRFNLASFGMNKTPDHGIKIKTNLPFDHSSQMPTVYLQGYIYGESVPVNLQLVWYVYNGKFVRSSITTSGGFTPQVFLGVENGKVVIFLDAQVYYPRFAVHAYETGRQADNNSWYNNWTVVDEPLNATNVVNLEYKNRFAGLVSIRDNGNQSGALYVDGKIEATEVKVTTDANTVPDYVFKPNYDLMPLDSLSKFVNLNSHLPEIPNAEQLGREGMDIGEMNLKLLKKVEELSLYLIEQNETIQSMNEKLDKQEHEIQKLKEDKP